MPRERIRAEIENIGPDDQFSFNCHPQVPCFTDCCRNLELALSPYDVLRLGNALALAPEAFLDRFAVVAMIPEEPLPQVMLAMNEEAGGRCPFVSDEGCRVYQDRPAACRNYPLGRGISAKAEGEIRERFVLLHEGHCRGFFEKAVHTPKGYLKNQGLAPYHRAAEMILSLRDRALARPGKLNDEEITRCLHTLYLGHGSDEEKPLKAGGEEMLNLLKTRVERVVNEIFSNG